MFSIIVNVKNHNHQQKQPKILKTTNTKVWKSYCIAQ